MNRDEILEAAAGIFSQKGFHASSMQDIAEAVSLQKASLYHHIHSKQEILLALLDRALDLLIERLTTVAESTLAPQEKLRAAIISYLVVLTENRQLAAILLLEHRSLDAEYKLRHIPRRDRFERLWRSMIEAGQAQGIFKNTNPAITSRALLGALNWTITWFQPGGEYTAEEIAGQYAELFLEGLSLGNGD